MWILLPGSFSSFMWEEVPIEILHENPGRIAVYVAAANSGLPPPTPKNLQDLAFLSLSQEKIGKRPKTHKFSKFALPEENAQKMDLVNLGGWGWGSRKWLFTLGHWQIL